MQSVESSIVIRRALNEMMLSNFLFEAAEEGGVETSSKDEKTSLAILDKSRKTIIAAITGCNSGLKQHNFIQTAKLFDNALKKLKIAVASTEHEDNVLFLLATTAAHNIYKTILATNAVISSFDEDSEDKKAPEVATSSTSTSTRVDVDDAAGGGPPGGDSEGLDSSRSAGSTSGSPDSAKKGKGKLVFSVLLNGDKEIIRQIVEKSFKPNPGFMKKLKMKTGFQALWDDLAKLKSDVSGPATESVIKQEQESINEIADPISAWAIAGAVTAAAGLFKAFKNRNAIGKWVKDFAKTGNVTGANSVAAYTEIFGTSQGIHKALAADLMGDVTDVNIEQLMVIFETQMKKLGLTPQDAAPSQADTSALKDAAKKAVKDEDSDDEDAKGENKKEDKKKEYKNITKKEADAIKESDLFGKIKEKLYKDDTDTNKKILKKIYLNLKNKRFKEFYSPLKGNTDLIKEFLARVFFIDEGDIIDTFTSKNKQKIEEYKKRNETGRSEHSGIDASFVEIKSIIEDEEDVIKVMRFFAKGDRGGNLNFLRKDFYKFMANYAADHFDEFIGLTGSVEESKKRQEKMILERWNLLAGIK